MVGEGHTQRTYGVGDSERRPSMAAMTCPVSKVVKFKFVVSFVQFRNITFLGVGGRRRSDSKDLWGG